MQKRRRQKKPANKKTRPLRPPREAARKPLGTVYRLAKNGLATVHLDTQKWRKPPRLGLKTYLHDKPVGRIVDVIGPVESPFAVVKLEAGATVREGETLHVEAPSRGKPRRASRRQARRGRPPRRPSRASEGRGKRRR